MPPNVYELAACIDWAVVACGPQKNFDWSPEVGEWVETARETLKKNGKSWADKQFKAGYVEDAVLSYKAALRYVGDGSAG